MIKVYQPSAHVHWCKSLLYSSKIFDPMVYTFLFYSLWITHYLQVNNNQMMQKKKPKNPLKLQYQFLKPGIGIIKA